MSVGFFIVDTIPFVRLENVDNTLQESRQDVKKHSIFLQEDTILDKRSNQCLQCHKRQEIFVQRT